MSNYVDKRPPCAMPIHQQETDTDLVRFQLLTINPRALVGPERALPHTCTVEHCCSKQISTNPAFVHDSEKKVSHFRIISPLNNKTTAHYIALQCQQAACHRGPPSGSTRSDRTAFRCQRVLLHPSNRGCQLGERESERVNEKSPFCISHMYADYGYYLLTVRG